MKTAYTVYDPDTLFVLYAIEAEEQPANSTTSIMTENFFKPKYDRTTDSFYEGATAEEIRQLDPKKQPEYYLLRIQDGIAYISQKTQQLIDLRDAGAVDNTTFEYIDDTVKDVRNALLGGQWKSALRELIKIQAKLSPTFYADLYNHINTYCNEHY